LFGHGYGVPELSVTDAQSVLFVAVVDLDLPAVEVDLEEVLGRGVEVSGEEVSGVAVVDLTGLALEVGGRCDDQEPEWEATCCPTPVDVGQLFVADRAPLSPVDDPGGPPRPGVVLANLFGGELLDRVEAP
jgi:hypothetical protein